MKELQYILDNMDFFELIIFLCLPGIFLIIWGYLMIYGIPDEP